MYEIMVKNGLILSFEEWYKELYALIIFELSYLNPQNAYEHYKQYVNEKMQSYNLPPHF